MVFWAISDILNFFMLCNWILKISFSKWKSLTISFKNTQWCIDVSSMFVLSKWQCVALPTRWQASVRALFYCYYTFLDHTTNMRRKLRAPRRVSASGAPINVQNCHLDKTNMDKTSQHPLSAGTYWKNRFGRNKGNVLMASSRAAKEIRGEFFCKIAWNLKKNTVIFV